jgi:hypothetical protein
LGQWVQPATGTGEPDRITELKQLILALSAFAKTKDKSYQPLETDSAEQMDYLKKLWTLLNTDISPALKTLRDNILDIYDPQLVPIHSGGITIEWVSARTGQRLWQ